MKLKATGVVRRIDDLGRVVIPKEMGATKVRILKTSGPFHTKKLIEASNALRKDLEKININKFFYLEF